MASRFEFTLRPTTTKSIHQKKNDQTWGKKSSCGIPLSSQSVFSCLPFLLLLSESPFPLHPSAETHRHRLPNPMNCSPVGSLGGHELPLTTTHPFPARYESLSCLLHTNHFSGKKSHYFKLQILLPAFHVHGFPVSPHFKEFMVS
ncbi:hypothetical protein K1719_026974 [Acacia pycnantha]|nr:hypothetical protein K1719_026974 [Acacia pycnantha]